MIKRIIYIILTILILGGSLYLATYAGIEHRHEHYRSFTLQIINPQEVPLITEEELIDTLKSRYGQIEGKSLDEVPLFEIENFLTSNPYILTANVYATLNGDIHASVETRIPMLRVINSFDESFLVDTNGVVMPVSPGHPIRLMVATGNIETHFRGKGFDIMDLESQSILRQVFETARVICHDEFLKAMFGQVYINEAQEIELFPKLGQQTVLFGTSEMASDKAKKLKAFYIQVMKHAGWDVYKTINLKFENQIVCSK